MFSVRTNSVTTGVCASRARQRSRIPRKPFRRPRASGSTHTCCTCTASGVHADASALKRTTSSSSQSHDRPSSICARVRHLNPSASAASGSRPSSARCAAAHAGTSRSRSASVAGRSPVSPFGGGSSMTYTGCPGRSSRGAGNRDADAAQSSPTARSSPITIRERLRAAASAKRSQASPDGTMFAPTWQSAVTRPSRSAAATNRPSPRRATSSRNTRSTGARPQNSSTSSSDGSVSTRIASRTMPIHVRAEQGDYAEAVLLPGDPLRAKYIAETYLEGVEQRNAERGLLGYTGTWNGKPVSVQGTGMGCPGATIVFEELVQLGCKKLIRVGTCGGLQAHHQLGDLIVALSAVPAGATAMHLVANEPHCPTASWSLIHGAVHAAKEIGQAMHVGPIVSSDLFYNPDEGQYERWSRRGVLAVEMEASALFTVGALRGVEAGCLLTVSDIVVEGVFTRISDEELRGAVDRMTRVALLTVTADH